MQKTKILCLILALALSSVGTVMFAQSLNGDTSEVVLPTDAINAYLDKPTEGDPSSREAIENLYIAAGELKRSGGFVGTSYGETVSVGLAQEVSNKRTVVNGSVFKEMATAGVVKNAYQLYLYGDNYLYRKPDKINSVSDIKWANSAQKYTREDFLGKFGHCSNELTGYILNDETIVSGTLESRQDGLFTYRYVLDTTKAPAYMLYEMRANSNMKGFSTFIKAEIVVTMDSDWQVKTLTTDCEYKVPMFGGVRCTEDITETFEQIGYQGDLPEKDFFEQYFDAQAERPIEEDDALTVLMNIFEPYISGGKLNVSLDVNMGDSTIMSALASAQIDIEHLENIAVDLKVGNDLYVSYLKNQLFVTYQDFKGSTTVDGIMGLVNVLIPNGIFGDSTDGSDNDSEESDILANASYNVEDGLCTVNLPIAFGDIAFDVNFYANVNGDKYEFVSAELVAGSITAEVKPIESFDVPARSGEYPEILGLTDLVQNGMICANIDAFGISADVLFDIASKSLYAECGDLTLNMQQGVLYAALGEVKLKLAVDDISDVIGLVGQYFDINIAVDMPEISLDAVLAMLNNISATSTENGGVAFKLEVQSISVVVNLVTSVNGWNIESIQIVFGESLITLAPVDAIVDVIPSVNAEEYADVKVIAETFLDEISSLINAQGFQVDVEGAIAFGSDIYGAQAQVAYNGGLYVNASLSYNSARMIDAEIWIVNGVAYLRSDKLTFALNIDSGSHNGENGANIVETLKQFKGYNDYIDVVIDLVADIVNKIESDSVNYVDLIGALTFDDGELMLGVNGSQLGLSDFSVAVNAENGLGLKLKGLTYGDVAISIDNATVKSASAKVVAPDGDFTTNIAIRVDDTNTIYANIDLLNGVYKLRLGDLNVRYSDNLIRISCADKIFAQGDISKIKELVQKIDDLVHEFSGAGANNVAAGLDIFSKLGEMDIKDIIKSLTISENDGNVQLGLTVMGLNVTATFANGTLDKITFPVTIKITFPVTEIKKTIEVYAANVNDYYEFSDNDDYVAIEQVLDDYMPSIEQLVATNCWKFVFTEDSHITIDTTVYTLNAGSYLEFYYNETDKSNTQLRAKLSLSTPNGTKTATYSIDAALIKDEQGVNRIYLTYNNKLRAAVSLDAIIGCKDEFTKLQKVVPQIGELLTKIFSAKDEVNNKEIDFSTILQDVSYVDNVFGIKVNGNVFLSALGDISLSAGQYGNGLRLNNLSLKYDNIQIEINGLTVEASTTVNDMPYDEVENADQYVAVQDILAYDRETYHINLDSIKELLSAFNITASDTVKNANGAEVRSFNLAGSVHLAVPLLADVDIQLFAKVDIDENDKTFFTIKLVRGSDGSVNNSEKLAYDDKGGNSYLYFDGKTERVTVIRNSYTDKEYYPADEEYCTECGSKLNIFGTCFSKPVQHGNEYVSVRKVLKARKVTFGYYEKNYAAENMTIEEFSANAMDCILEMVNFSSSIKDQITKPQENTNEYGIEDIIKDYSYDNGERKFNAAVDLSPINGALGTLKLAITHAEETYKLTNLHGTIKLVSLLDTTLDIDLIAPAYGVATDLVQNAIYW